MNVCLKARNCTPSPRKNGAVLGTPQFASESLDADTR
jgi:hypothetical protein